MKVILETNLLISALISPRGVPDRLYRAWRDGRFALVTSIEQLEEFRRATRYPRVRKYLAPAAAGAMHNNLLLLAEIVTELPLIDMSPDPSDNFLLPMAVASNADFLATGDKCDLLLLKRFGRTQIVTARTLAAAKVLGISQPKVSALRNYKLDGFSVERSMGYLKSLGSDIEIRVRAASSRTRTTGRITVHAA